MPLRVLAEFLLLYLTCADYNGKGLGTIIKARRPDTRGEYMKKEEAFQEIINAQSYHVFFYPFQWKDNGSLKKAEDEIAKYNDKNDLCWKPCSKPKISGQFGRTHSDRMLYKTFHYFNNSSRDLVFGRSGIALKYELCNKKDGSPVDGHMRINEKNQSIELRLLSVKLDLYEFGVGIITYEAAYQKNDDNLLLKDLLRSINLINEKGRRLFPPFIVDYPAKTGQDSCNTAPDDKLTADNICMEFELGDEKTTLSQDFSTVVDRLTPIERNGRLEIRIKKALPEYITGLIPFVAETITDDRMFCCSLIMNDKVADNMKCYRDGECGSFTEDLYKYAFIEQSVSCTSIPMRKKILRECVYDRWVEYGTIYVATHHSFVSAMGDVSQADRPVYLVENFVELYVPIVKIVLIQRAELLVFLKRASELAISTKDYNKNCMKLLKESNCYKQDYSRFLNEFMLPEISPEEQAVDLYDLVQEQLYIKQMRESLTEQTQILYDITQTLVAYQRQKNDRRLESILACISVAGIWYGFSQVFIGYISIGPKATIFRDFATCIIVLSFILLIWLIIRFFRIIIERSNY